MPVVLFKVLDSTVLPNPAPVLGTLIKIMSGTTEVAVISFSNAAGTSLSIANGSYTALLSKINYYFQDAVAPFTIINTTTSITLEGAGVAQTITAPSAELIKVVADIANPDGSPKRGAVILIDIEPVPPALIGGRSVDGYSIQLITDDFGHAETFLPKGAVIRVVATGTPGFQRTLSLPTSGTEVDIFQLARAQADYFNPRKAITYPFELS